MVFRLVALTLFGLVPACSPSTISHAMLAEPGFGMTPARASVPGATVEERAPSSAASRSRVEARRVSSTARLGPEHRDPDRLARAVLREANAARRRAGSRALRVDAALTRAAERYARELAGRGKVEHVSRIRGRRTFRDRIHAEGGRARVAGENLARLTSSGDALASRVVRAWLDSPGHRANLLASDYARTGVGVWLGRDGVWYVVQLFASAR